MTGLSVVDVLGSMTERACQESTLTQLHAAATVWRMICQAVAVVGRSESARTVNPLGLGAPSRNRSQPRRPQGGACLAVFFLRRIASRVRRSDERGSKPKLGSRQRRDLFTPTPPHQVRWLLRERRAQTFFVVPGVALRAEGGEIEAQRSRRKFAPQRHRGRREDWGSWELLVATRLYLIANCPESLLPLGWRWRAERAG